MRLRPHGLRERLRAARPMLVGRPHEAAGNGSPRWMAAGQLRLVHRTRPTGRLARRPRGQVTRVLQPFQRLTARPADGEGLGLGLSIVAAIAKAHHATLTINPRQRGGLDIDIDFPPATRATQPVPAALATA